jgi:hypothetical protein
LRIERRRAVRWTASHTALRWAFGACEGATAAAVVFVPTLFYHLVVEHTALTAIDWPLYLAFAGIAALVYGAFSVAAAGKFLESGRHQQSVITDSALGWTGAFAVALLTAFLAGVTGELSRVSLTSAYVIGVPLLIGGRSIVHGVASAIYGPGGWNTARPA